MRDLKITATPAEFREWAHGATDPMHEHGYLTAADTIERLEAERDGLRAQVERLEAERDAPTTGDITL
jgi:hypothetical protein